MFRRAAKLGHADAATYLVACLLNVLCGFEKGESSDALEQSAHEAASVSRRPLSPVALYTRGCCWEYGNGMPLDKRAALECYERRFALCLVLTCVDALCRWWYADAMIVW